MRLEEALAGLGLPDLLDRARAYVRRFVVMSPEALDTTALFVAHTHAFEAADTTLYLDITSPAPESGKTRLFEVLQGIVRSPFMVTSPSTAAIFRVIDENVTTVLLDEIDAVFGGDKASKADMISILNAGYRRGAEVPRVIGEGKSMKVKRFKVFAPKAFAGIGRKLPPATQSRTVPIRLKRKKAGEEAERFRIREQGEANDIRQAFELWAGGAIPRLAFADPAMPLELSDRQMDAWEPLFAIADEGGEDWPTRARAAAVALHDRRDEVALAEALLADIRVVFDDQGDRIFSEDLAKALNAMEESGWGGWSDGAGIRPYEIARHLKDFDIGPTQIKIGGVGRKGYKRSMFEDAWERYAAPKAPPDPPDANLPETPKPSQVRGHFQGETAENPNGSKSAPDQQGFGVSAKTASEGKPDGFDALIRGLWEAGERNLFTISRTLNASGHRHPDGHRWTAEKVRVHLGHKEEE